MKPSNINKTFAILLFVVLTTDILVLFTILYNTLIKNATIENENTLYILLGIMLILTVLFFINNMNTLKHKHIPTQNLLDNTISEQFEKSKEKDKKDKKEEKDENEKLFKINELSKKIIPKITSNTKPDKYTEAILSRFAKEFKIVEGLFFLKDSDKKYKISGLYAYYLNEKPKDFTEGEGLSGQVVKDKTILNIKNVPEGYITVLSGLGEGTPKHMLIIPVLFEENVIGLIELASFNEFDDTAESIIKEISVKIGENINNLLKSGKNK